MTRQRPPRWQYLASTNPTSPRAVPDGLAVPSRSAPASGGSGAFISNDELIRSMALQIAPGSPRAGTVLQGFEQQCAAGCVSEAAANLLIKTGIIHGGGDARHNPYLAKSGILLRLSTMDTTPPINAGLNP
jgi:hypothetical protein